MSRATADDQLRFLLSCVRHSNNGKIEFVEVAKECGVVSKGAAAKRYERLLKANGIHPACEKPVGVAQLKEKSKAAIAKAAAAKRRKIEGDLYDIKQDDEEDIKPNIFKQEPLDSFVKSEPGTDTQPFARQQISVTPPASYFAQPAQRMMPYTGFHPTGLPVQHGLQHHSWGEYSEQHHPSQIQNLEGSGLQQVPFSNQHCLSFRSTGLNDETTMPQKMFFDEFCPEILLKHEDGSTEVPNFATPLDSLTHTDRNDVAESAREITFPLPLSPQELVSENLGTKMYGKERLVSLTQTPPQKLCLDPTIDNTNMPGLGPEAEAKGLHPSHHQLSTSTIKACDVTGPVSKSMLPTYSVPRAEPYFQEFENYVLITD